MKYIKGDIIALAKTGQWDVIIHGCNCFCTMGGGIALPIKNEWPGAYAADCNTVKGDILKLGSFSWTMFRDYFGEDRDFYVINAYTQYEYGAGKRQLDYAAVIGVFDKLSDYDSGWSDMKFLIPKIGAGLAGGDWALIEKIIDAYDLDVTCCVLE